MDGSDLEPHDLESTDYFDVWTPWDMPFQNSGYAASLPPGSYVGSAQYGLAISLWFRLEDDNHWSGRTQPNTLFAMSRLGTAPGSMNTTLLIQLVRGEHNRALLVQSEKCCVSAGPGSSSDSITSDVDENMWESGFWGRFAFSTTSDDYGGSANDFGHGPVNVVITFDGSGALNGLYLRFSPTRRE